MLFIFTVAFVAFFVDDPGKTHYFLLCFLRSLSISHPFRSLSLSLSLPLSLCVVAQSDSDLSCQTFQGPEILDSVAHILGSVLVCI